MNLSSKIMDIVEIVQHYAILNEPAQDKYQEKLNNAMIELRDIALDVNELEHRIESLEK